EEVDHCQIYLGLFGSKYGKYTIDEYECATQSKKPRLIFVKAEREREKLVPPRGRDEQLSLFLDEIAQVESGLTPVWFTDLEDLEKRVTRAIYPFVTQFFPGWKVPEWREKFDMPFVGREREIIELTNILDKPEPVALTALEGIGGLGKTYLALKMAQ